MPLSTTEVSRSRCRSSVAALTAARRGKRPAGGGARSASWRTRGSRSTPISASAEWTSHGFQCSYFADCEYIQTRRPAYGSPFVILVHSHLGLEWGATAAERASWASDRPVEEDDAERPCATSTRSGPTSSICDEDPIVEPARTLVR